MSAEAPTRAHLRVYGRVQGVYFRVCTQREAQALGLVGWVRNRRDGTVEVVCEGAPAAVDALCVWAEQGPPTARVEFVERSDSAPVGLTGAFAVRPTH
ncbi:MAG: acylphosphatase [Deltaproteobacteria bacterium]|nr:acylphosphatase [Deltaproteobacteria bacterium]